MTGGEQREARGHLEGACAYCKEQCVVQIYKRARVCICQVIYTCLTTGIPLVAANSRYTV
jgi:hypothetical protein